MSISQNFPNTRPSLNLNFARSKTLDPRITFTRTSTGTYVDESGVIRNAVADEPRFDHDPVTGECLGLLIEEQKTNLIRNNTMQGAVVGTPGTAPTYWSFGTSTGGISREIVGVGEEDGISYIDVRWYGTATTNPITYFSFNPESNNSSFPGTRTVRYTFSNYIKVVGGTVPSSSTFIVVFYNFNSSFVNLQQYQVLNIPLTDTLNKKLIENRYSYTNGDFASTDTAYIRPYYQWNFTYNEPIDITLRIGMPQVELSSFASSVIPTEGSTKTRAKEYPTVSGTNFTDFYNPNEGTFYIKYNIEGFYLTDGFNRIFEVSDGGGVNRYTALLRGINQDIYDSGWNISLNFNTSLITFGDFYTYIMGYKENDFQRYAIDRNGDIDSNTDTSVAVSSFIPTELNIGYEAINDIRQLNGHISQLVYYPSRLSNSQLQTLLLQ